MVTRRRIAIAPWGGGDISIPDGAGFEPPTAWTPWRLLKFFYVINLMWFSLDRDGICTGRRPRSTLDCDGKPPRFLGTLPAAIIYQLVTDTYRGPNKQFATHRQYSKVSICLA